MFSAGAAPWLACYMQEAVALLSAADPADWRAAAMYRIIATQRTEWAELCAAGAQAESGTPG